MFFKIFSHFEHLNENQGKSKKIDENQRKSMKIYENQRKSMTIYETLWKVYKNFYKKINKGKFIKRLIKGF